MLELRILQTNNRNLEDFVEVKDIRENENGVIDIFVTSPRFKYWDIHTSSGCEFDESACTISSSIHYDKETGYRISDWDDVDEDTMEYETFIFDVSFEEEYKNTWDYYETIITPLKYEYEIKLIPQKLLDTHEGVEVDWEEIVYVDNLEEDEDESQKERNIHSNKI